MDTTLKSRDSDPHDIFVIAPEVVPAAWADKVLADITNDAANDDNRIESKRTNPGAAGIAAAPTVDATFRATAINDIPVATEQPSTGGWTKRLVMLAFAVCSTAAAVAWQNHGDTAKQIVSNWMPAFAFASSAQSDQTAQVETPAVQAPATEQTSSQPVAPAPSSPIAAPAAGSSPEAAQLQVMSRDLAAMAQQIEQLKASIAELKASPPAVREVTKTSEVKPAEPKPVVQTPRPKASPPPPRTAAAPQQRTLPAYPPTQAAAPASLPQHVAPPASTLPAPPPPQAATRTEDGEPVVRPPMPLRWGPDVR